MDARHSFLTILYGMTDCRSTGEKHCDAQAWSLSESALGGLSEGTLGGINVS